MSDIKYTESTEADLIKIIDFKSMQWGKQQTHQYLDDLEEARQSPG